MTDFALHWREYAAEFRGTALLLLFGLSVVTIMFGEGSPAAAFIPSVTIRQIITGLLFGSVGASIAISPIGSVRSAARTSVLP